MNQQTQQPFSRRQKLYDLMRTTKDVYIPTISSTISQLASEATNKALSYTNEEELRSQQEQQPSNKNFKGCRILIYPHYTSRDLQNNYVSQVHGWVYNSDSSSRKKKLLFSLAKQLARTGNNSNTIAANNIEEQIDNLDSESDNSSVYSSSTNSSSVRRTGTFSSLNSVNSANSVDSYSDEVLRERMASFLNKSVDNLKLIISIGGFNSDEFKSVEYFTDANGNFNVNIVTAFKPSFIQVSVAEDESIFNTRESLYLNSSNYAIITDIDDTIKNTGVCLDKRSVFRNTFVDELNTWEIPGVSDWFRFLQNKFDISFFYVSNSPYQLYSNLIKFFQIYDFPKGAIYLKRYTGNIINSFMEPSSTRKKKSLESIANNFPHLRFILIGDTSEQDLEAYVDFTKNHPDQIKAIYLRLAPNSMSTETFKSLVDILDKKGNLPTSIEAQPKLETPDLIDLDDQPPAPSAPPLPPKPDYLKSTPSSATSPPVEPPTLPQRPSSARSLPPPPPPRRKYFQPITQPSSANTVPFTQEANDEWISRILTSLVILRKVNPEIKLKLYKDIDEINEQVVQILSER